MSETSLPIGTSIAGHVVTEVLGQGGFGITYKAVSKDGKHIAALKEFFPSEDAVRGPALRVSARPEREDYFDMGYKAFLKEAQTLHRLTQKMNLAPAKRARGLVRIIGAFEKHDTVYCLMDFIDGKPLDKAMSRFLRREPNVPVHLLQDLAGALLQALAIVHREGVLHRDVKPGNVMIRRDGQPILIDFGAARPMGRESDLASMFSRRYAALEQFPPGRTGHKNPIGDGPWTDLFALSVMLYELVSQSLPTNAKERWDSLRKTGQDPYVPVRDNILRNRVTARYPDVLLDAIDAGCVLFAQDRPRSAEDMALSLEGFVSELEPTPTVRPGPGPDGQDLLRQMSNDGKPSAREKKSSSGTSILLLIVALAVGVTLFGYLMP